VRGVSIAALKWRRAAEAKVRETPAVVPLSGKEEFDGETAFGGDAAPAGNLVRMTATARELRPADAPSPTTSYEEHAWAS
jgi:hypothetical protein